MRASTKRLLGVGVSVVLLAALAVTPALAGLGPTVEKADVMVQGGGDAYAENGAVLVRRGNSIRVRLAVPTPAPGSYNYPDGTEEGALEAFTGWAFVFNNPGKCEGPCDGGDIGGPANVGVYHIDGRVAWGDTLVLSRKIKVGDARFGGTHDLSKPRNAEVHVAIAPHGTVAPGGAADEASLRALLTTPIGDPSVWWAALFK